MKLRTKVAALAVAAASVGTAGIVYAAWTSEATGTGSAASTTSTNGVISGVTPLVAANELYPGATLSAFVSITNPNDYPVVVTKIYSGASRQSSGGCVANTVRTDEVANATGITRSDAASAVIAANSSGQYLLTLRMANDAADNCKSQSFVLGDGANSANDMHADVKSAATANGF